MGGKKRSKKKGKKNTQEGALEVVVMGLSHHNAAVDVREKLAIAEVDWNAAAAKLTTYPGISEAAVLSTCNRFELYLAGGNQYECIRDATDFLGDKADGSIDAMTLRKNVFMLSGEDAIWHALRVSAGLDSLVVGEGQILSQMKRAYERGIEEEDEEGLNAGQSGKVVSRLLNVAVTAGKRVRSETGISKGAVSISSAAAEFTQFVIEETSEGNIKTVADSKITIIGAGKMARLLLVHLQTQKVTEVTIVNRSPGSVEALREEFPGVNIIYEPLASMLDVIQESDVVYPSTASEVPIIFADDLRSTIAKRQRSGGVQFVDISVPRNVDADCSEVKGAYCYNVDDLKAVVEKNTAMRKREMVEAEFILREEQDKFRLWQQSLGAIPTIAKLQEKAEILRVQELEKVMKKLSNLDAKDLDTVERLSKGIVAKLLHGPMTHLRQQKEGDGTREAIKQVQQAFQLDVVDGSL